MAGIIDTIKLAGVLVFAIPAVLAGLELLLVRDEPFYGGMLLVLAVGLVLIQRRLTLPTDVPGLVVKRLVGTVTSEPDSKDTDRTEERE